MTDSVQQIKEKLDIVDVIKERIQLTPAGKNFKGVCPFHREKTPSFIVSPDRQTWHCFGSCGEGGDVFSFVMKYENIEFYEALKLLAEKAGIELKHTNPAMQQEFGVLYDIQATAETFFMHQLKQNSDAQTYLQSRDITADTQELFGIGYAPHESDALAVNLVNAGYEMKDIERAGLVIKTERGNYVDRFRGRIMFPLKNTFGKTVGFSGRIMPAFENEKTGKYVNSPETPIFNKSKVLYGFDMAKPYIREMKECIVVEGQMDLIAMHQDGVKNTIATSGTALTNLHLQTLSKLTDQIVFFFDNDEAGLMATERAIDLSHTLDFTVRVYHTTQEKDASEFIQKHPHVIAQDIRVHAQNALVYYIERYVPNPQGTDVKRGLRSVLEKLQYIPSPIEQTRWIRALAEYVHMPEQTLVQERALLQKTKKTTPAHSEISPASVSPLPEHTRSEKIIAHILRLVQYIPSAWSDIDAYRPFIPSSYISIIDALQHKKASPELDAVAAFIELQSAMHITTTEPEKVILEIQYLLRELKKEYLKERREEIMKKMRVIERQDDQKEQLAALLKEFDEITKLIDN
ncbi:MAG: DNA primase [Candidatus Paceibacterota bacterium]